MTSFDRLKRTLLFALAGALLFTACTSQSKKDRTPHVYRGGQYYGDAIHE